MRRAGLEPNTAGLVRHLDGPESQKARKLPLLRVEGLRLFLRVRFQNAVNDETGAGQGILICGQRPVDMGGNAVGGLRRNAEGPFQN